MDEHMDDPVVQQWVRESAKNAEIVLSVCNGAFFLGRAGLLDGLEATTFAGLIDELQKAAPKARVVRNKRFVDNGKIITSAGLSSGIDGSLHVIDGFSHGRSPGRGHLARVRLSARRADTCRDAGYRHLRGAYDAVRQFDRTVVSHEGNRDRWETRWLVRTDLSPREVLAKLEAAIPAAKGWSRDTSAAVAAASSPGAARAVWRYRDETGQGWVATAVAEPAPREKGRALMTVGS